MDLWSMDRCDCWMRRVVGAASADLLLLDCVEHASVVGCILRAGVSLQLSALHGYDLPGLPSRGRFSEIPHLHDAHHGADCADAAAGAFVGPDSAVDFHHLSNLEPVALQRAELWLVHDVRPARGSEAE